MQHDTIFLNKKDVYKLPNIYKELNITKKNIYKIRKLILNKNLKRITAYPGDFTHKPLEEIVFNENLSEIGSRAFSLTNIKKLEFNKNLTMIGYYTFSECKSLESLSFKSYTNIYYDAFKDCENIKQIEFDVDGKNKKFTLSENQSFVELHSFGEESDNIKYILKYKDKIKKTYEEIIFDPKLMESTKKNRLIALPDEFRVDNLVLPNNYESIKLALNNVSYNTFDLSELKCAVSITTDDSKYKKIIFPYDVESNIIIKSSSKGFKVKNILIVSPKANTLDIPYFTLEFDDYISINSILVNKEKYIINYTFDNYSNYKFSKVVDKIFYKDFSVREYNHHIQTFDNIRDDEKLHSESIFSKEELEKFKNKIKEGKINRDDIKYLIFLLNEYDDNNINDFFLENNRNLK